jgi:hypothetical protein
MKFNLHILKTLKENCVLITKKKITNPYQPKKGLTFYDVPFQVQNVCWCSLWGQNHSIFTYDNWNVMIWKDKYKTVPEWNCQVGDHMTNYGKKIPIPALIYHR